MFISDGHRGNFCVQYFLLLILSPDFVCISAYWVTLLEFFVALLKSSTSSATDVTIWNNASIFGGSSCVLGVLMMWSSEVESYCRCLQYNRPESSLLVSVLCFFWPQTTTNKRASRVKRAINTCFRDWCETGPGVTYALVRNPQDTHLTFLESTCDLRWM